MLLDAGADVKAIGKTALERAAVAGHIGVVKLLLERKALFDIRRDDCLSILEEAAANDSDDVVRFLVEEGQKSTTAYKTALFKAAKDGAEDVVNILLTMGTKPDNDDQEKAIQLLLDHDSESGGSNPTALQSAAGAGHEMIVKLLLIRMSDINTDSSQESPLQLAAKNGHSSIVGTLLDNNANINDLGFTGTALQLAAENGHDQTVWLLLERGADVNASSARGTALQLAAAAGHLSIVKFLIAHQANANATIPKSALPPNTAPLEDGGATEADFNAKGSNNTALQNAAAAGHKSIVRTLLNAGANKNAQGGDYGSALQAAVVEGKVGMVELLVDEGAEDFSVGGKKKWNQATSSWVETTQAPQLRDDEQSLPANGTDSNLPKIDQKALLVQLAMQNDNRKRREASQKHILYDPSLLQVQRTRSRTGSHASIPSISELQEKYSRNPLSLQSMAERSPVSSPRPMSPRPTSPIMPSRLSATDLHSPFHSRSGSPV
jgi:ankyrin repeat protein